MKPTLLTVLIALGISYFSLAQPIQEVAPATANVSVDRLKRVDQFIQGYIDNKNFSGLTAVIVRDGKIVYNKAFGMADIERKIPMRKDHIFRIASMSKAIISTAAMILFEEGKFSLDEPLSKYIPEFKDPVVLDKYNPKDTTYTTIKAKSDITIRQLLTHTSGIGYAQIGSAEANAIYYKNGINGGIGTPYSTLKDIIPKMGKLPLFSHPGEAFLYGLNTDVLGHFVEVVSGMPLDQFLQKRIFGPLGMKDTYFYLPKEKQNRLVVLYGIKDGKLTKQDSLIPLNGTFYRDFPNSPGGTYFSGGAGLASTAYDYALFCTMYLNGGILNGTRILSPYTIRLITSNQIGDLKMWGENRFGLGFGITTKKGESVDIAQEGTYDWGGMFASHFWIDPKSKLTVVIMRNVWPSDTWDFGDRVRSVVYQALEK